ncbi:hypothetical protein [cf. Phormidesmis sp. LEGE 11477]|uniref:hypothetical protein n=1 Tax=cf. Phormidesmis sp. LEGE 11477 TaxID=1828680 RepID=UPI00187FDD02|nr:hypothetical protein [cf. Phormidesmis sp. LEGE 11477]MBE9065000.1 hypothetical protein [cf. Phormidesmis sp. LEGE 11477]
MSLNQFHIPVDQMLKIANTTYDLAQHGEMLSLSIWAGPSRELMAGQKPIPVPLPSVFPQPVKLTPLPVERQ